MPVSVPGDLWLCGPHRVLCGDATEATAVSRLLGTAVPVLMITDPPYGVNYDPLWREEAGLGAQRQTGTVENDDRVDWSEAFCALSRRCGLCLACGAVCRGSRLVPAAV